MFAPFPQELAHHYCLELVKKLDDDRVCLEQIARESQERKNQGLMLGCLIAWDRDAKKRKILYALSGNAKVVNDCSGVFKDRIFVDSIVSFEEITQALQQNDQKIHQLTDEINSLSEKIDEHGISTTQKTLLIKERTKLTDQSLQKVFSLYNFTRFDGKKISLKQIIQKHGGHLPPAGTGDCCAPKLLNYAFTHSLEIVSMDEIYYGPDTKNKKKGISYTPCDERCAYILPCILGLEILYRDKDIIVVNKESGLLSVPGRGPDKTDCVEARIKRLFPDCISQPAVHRLDMETSGILILARNKEAHRNLEMQFANGQVRKKYEALLDGILRGKPEGHIELKFRLDPDNRPYQLYDEENGKLGITDWKKLSVEKWINPVSGQEKTVTRIEFSPKTGRTHQLRLASSCPKGLGLPILGDSLYGNFLEGERLMLHASEITFHHPTSGEEMYFYSKPEF